LGPQCRRPFSLSHINFPISQISLNAQKTLQQNLEKSFKRQKFKLKSQKETIEQNGVCVHMCWCVCMTPNHWKRLTKPLPQNFSFKTKPSWEKIFISSGHGGGLNFPFSSSPTPLSISLLQNFLFHASFHLLASLLYISLHTIQIPLPLSFEIGDNNSRTQIACGFSRILMEF